MKQMTFADAEYAGKRKQTRKELFLIEMDQVVPWKGLVALIEPHYPKPGNGRPPIGLERMLRIHLLQHWFNLADEACEEALLDSTALRRFVGLPQGRLEAREKLEQLRALEAGMRIDAIVVDDLPLGVDTPADLARARAILSARRLN